MVGCVSWDSWAHSTFCLVDYEITSNILLVYRAKYVSWTDSDIASGGGSELLG